MAVQAPSVTAQPSPMCLHGSLPRPFGTPQTAMGAVRYNLANLMNWTAYLEFELAQVATAQCESFQFNQVSQPPFAAPSPQGPPSYRHGRAAR